jgi:hypothetical protein
MDKFPPGTPADELIAPAQGITVKHIATGEDLHVDLSTLAKFLLLTMADFAEQMHSWQDDMFENHNGWLAYDGQQPAVLWPAQVRPARWMSALSRMGRLLQSAKEQLAAAGHPAAEQLVLPPVFSNCTALLREEDQEAALQLYCRVTDELRGPKQQEAAAAALEQAIKHNPYAAEPHVLLAQLHLQAERWEEAEFEAAAGLKLLCDWGTVWDKRMPWDAWVSWTRVLLRAAHLQQFPSTSFGMLNLGIVEGI